MNTIANMTLEELKTFIIQVIDERLSTYLDRTDQEGELSWDEIRANVEAHRWTPPPGSKSALELLREDRDA